MKFAYHLEPEDRDEHGHWQPRIVWADGMVTLSLARIKAESFEQAQREVGQLNWSYAISAEDAHSTITSARLTNATLNTDREPGYGTA